MSGIMPGNETYPGYHVALSWSSDSYYEYYEQSECVEAFATKGINVVPTIQVDSSKVGDMRHIDYLLYRTGYTYPPVDVYRPETALHRLNILRRASALVIANKGSTPEQYLADTFISPEAGLRVGEKDTQYGLSRVSQEDLWAAAGRNIPVYVTSPELPEAKDPYNSVAYLNKFGVIRTASKGQTFEQTITGIAAHMKRNGVTAKFTEENQI